MSSLPSSYDSSWTLSEAVTRKGVGLHTGCESEVCLIPSNKAGYHLSWFDSDAPAVTLTHQQVRDSQLCTTLHVGERHIATVEHLLAAIAGSGLTNLEIKVS